MVYCFFFRSMYVLVSSIAKLHFLHHYRMKMGYLAVLLCCFGLLPHIHSMYEILQIWPINRDNNVIYWSEHISRTQPIFNYNLCATTYTTTFRLWKCPIPLNNLFYWSVFKVMSSIPDILVNNDCFIHLHALIVVRRSMINVALIISSLWSGRHAICPMLSILFNQDPKKGVCKRHDEKQC